MERTYRRFRFLSKINYNDERDSKKHMEKYQPKFDAVLNRLTKEFLTDFCFADGRIDWEKLVRFVSSKKS